jgi:chromosome segregation ATPase
MTLASKVVNAILRAQSRIDEAKQRLRYELMAKGESLRKLSEMPVDVDTLERRRLHLQSEIEELEREAEQLENNTLRALNEEFHSKLHSLWQELCGIYKSRAMELRSIQISDELQSALRAFDDVLKSAEIKLSAATPAQIRSYLSRLGRDASLIREQIENLAKRASQRIANDSQLHNKSKNLAEKKRQINEGLKEVRNKLQQHELSDNARIVQDIMTAETGALRQLRRDIFEPKIIDARREREKGLAGDDPLECAQQLSRSDR